MKKKIVLPKRIFVTVEDPGPDQYLVAWKDSSEVEDGLVVGVYELVETKKQQITTQLVDL